MPKKTRGLSTKRQTPKRPSKRPPKLPKIAAKPLSNNPFLALLREVKPDVDVRLRGFLDAKLDTARARGPEVTSVLEALSNLCLRGGKRLRPALLVAGFRASRETDDWEVALDCGVALELLQAYFLIHDDWMDRDAFRRGAPSVHSALSKRFRSTHLGASAAVLAGDYAAALATEALSRVDIPAKRMAALFASFAQMQADAVTGQQLDILSQAGNIEETYRLKTASYTVRGPLILGGLIAGAKPRLLEDLERFALPAGIAFQLRDDWLGLFGRTKSTGKPFGSDLKSGKRTLLVEYALSHGSKAQRAAIRRVFNNPKATKKQLQTAVKAIQDSGAARLSDQRMKQLTHNALEVLEASKLPKSGRTLLHGAVTFMTKRLN